MEYEYYVGDAAAPEWEGRSTWKLMSPALARFLSAKPLHSFVLMRFQGAPTSWKLIRCDAGGYATWELRPRLAFDPTRYLQVRPRTGVAPAAPATRRSRSRSR